MTTVPHPQSRPLVDSCTRCGNPLAGSYCHACGAEIHGPRLTPGSLFAAALGRVSWAGSRLARTLFDLTLQPAQVCWIYLSGHRDRYLHPVHYAAFALLLERFAAWAFQAASGLVGRPGTPLLFQPSAFGWLSHLPILLVAVVIWRVLFRGSGYNLAEMLAIGLYLFGHFLVLWTAFASLTSLLPVPEVLLVRWSVGLQALLGLVYLTWAGRGVFRENPVLVAVKVGVSVAVPIEIVIALDSLMSRG